MVKSIDEGNFEESKNVRKMLIILNVALLIFDLVWVFTMGSVWHGKPTHDKIIWEGFSGLHTFIITLSVINIIIRIIAIIFLALIFTQGNKRVSAYSDNKANDDF